jgi:hypothetical protein
MDRERLLPLALKALAVIFIFGVWPLMMIWPAGWQWEPHNDHYAQMICAIYATLGVFLFRAAKNPAEHRSLLQFTLWSSLAHGGTMLVQALSDADEHMHLAADVPALFLIAAVLAVLMPEPARQAGTRQTL